MCHGLLKMMFVRWCCQRSEQKMTKETFSFLQDIVSSKYVSSIYCTLLQLLKEMAAALVLSYFIAFSLSGRVAAGFGGFWRLDQ